MRLKRELLPHKPRGFTLIELIMTIVVVGVVALPISITLSQHIQSVFQSQDMTVALNLARFDLELMNNANYTTGVVPFSGAHYQNPNYYLDREVSTVNPLVNKESTVKVTVWIRKSAGGPILVKLVTYISGKVGGYAQP